MGTMSASFSERDHKEQKVLRWALGYDHAGFKLAQHLAKYLGELRYRVIHYGPQDDIQSADYVPFSIAAAKAVAEGRADYGVVIGGSGQGEQIAANKVRGIRAALCNDIYFAKLARRDNNANVLALAARVVAKEYAEIILNVWISTEFEAGRHKRRIDMIATYEDGRLSLPEARNIS